LILGKLDGGDGATVAAREERGASGSVSGSVSGKADADGEEKSRSGSLFAGMSKPRAIRPKLDDLVREVGEKIIDFENGGTDCGVAIEEGDTAPPPTVVEEGVVAAAANLEASVGPVAPTASPYYRNKAYANPDPSYFIDPALAGTPLPQATLLLQVTPAAILGSAPTPNPGAGSSTAISAPRSVPPTPAEPKPAPPLDIQHLLSFGATPAPAPVVASTVPAPAAAPTTAVSAPEPELKVEPEPEPEPEVPHVPAALSPIGSDFLDVDALGVPDNAYLPSQEEIDHAAAQADYVSQAQAAQVAREEAMARAMDLALGPIGDIGTIGIKLEDEGDMDADGEEEDAPGELAFPEELQFLESRDALGRIIL
jgi:hypothetical protein